jgi:hypothetical protein
MASLLCCECFEYDCVCAGLPVRPRRHARVAARPTVRPVGSSGVERAVAAGMVDPFDSPRCPRCGGEVDPAQWACMPCGWMGFDKYAA